MVLEAIRVIAALLLILFLPGFFFIQSLFPMKNELDENDDLLYRLILSVTMSIIFTIIIGFFLGSLGVDPDTGKGYFQTPYIITSLGIFCIILFVIGLYRGAYPMFLKKIKPEAELPVDDALRSEFIEVLEKWRDIKEKINRIEVQITEEPKSNRRRLVARRNRYLRDFSKLDEKVKRMSGKTLEIKTEAKKLHELIREWKHLKEELHQCEDRLELCSGELYEHNKKLAADLQDKIDSVEQNISFLRDDDED
jgi:hypothetical protein